MPRESWKELLEPFAEELDEQPDFGEAMHRARKTIEKALAAKSDAELRRLVRAANQASDTNCWYAIWDAAPLVGQVAKRILERRARFPELVPKEAMIRATEIGG